MPALALRPLLRKLMGADNLAVFKAMIVAPAAAHAVQLIVGQLVALGAGEHHDVFGRLAVARLFLPLGGQVFELHIAGPLLWLTGDFFAYCHYTLGPAFSSRVSATNDVAADEVNAGGRFKWDNVFGERIHFRRAVRGNDAFFV